ncbi:MAG: peptidoglycan/xylan/chitin deacetylase (PgdA/CDA1 family), partial [bacterium]
HHKVLTYINPVLRSLRNVGVKLSIVNNNHLRVLIFHDIPPNQEAAFQRQLEWIQKNWNIVSPEKFEKMISGNEPIIGKNILITFDDGLLSNRIVAEKILNPMGIKALFFVVSDFADISDRDEAHQFIADHIVPEAKKEDIPKNWNNMEWSDLSALLEQGHTIGCHTKRHTRLCDGVTKDQLVDELITSANYIESKLCNQVKHFAFTFGDIDSFSQDALSVASSRFQYIYSGVRGDNTKGVSPLAIRRDAAASQNTSYEYSIFENNLLDAFLGGVADFRYRDPRKKLDLWSQSISHNE